jgi:hypothetical protein
LASSVEIGHDALAKKKIKLLKNIEDESIPSPFLPPHLKMVRAV